MNWDNCAYSVLFTCSKQEEFESCYRYDFLSSPSQQCDCDSHSFSYYTGSIYFSSEHGGETVKETNHVCKVNSLGMGGCFPSVSHNSFYGTETQIYRHRNCNITRVLQ